MRRPAVILTAVTISMWFVGCQKPVDQPQSASLAVRAERVAFSGAPPVIPHAPISGKCITCHSKTGTQAPGIGSGVAPANPHTETVGMSEQSHCRQCHVFQQTQEVFRENELIGLKRPAHGERAFASAPPTIPHDTFMRENCAACHIGSTVRAEIRCSHPRRTRCLQCHLQLGTPAAPQLAEAD